MDEKANRTLITRLRRIEGQVRGVQEMVGENRYCVDVLTQLSATQEALRGVSRLVIEQHLRHCLRGACGPDPDDERLDELIEELVGVLRKHR